MGDNNIDKTFKPTVEWMAEKYDEMNMKLFNNELDSCNFAIFTTGEGSQGGVLGWFKITNNRIYANRSNRHMYISDGWGDTTYINKANFARICRPQIELNGNYTGTEHGFLATLVHEMCHYYTYMYGYIPKQGHGREFKEIGMIVSSRSNGLFTVQRIASAEQMSELELNAEMRAKKDKRIANKKAVVSALVVLTKEGKVKLTISSNQNLLNMIKKIEQDERGDDVIITNDANIIDYLFSKGYRKNMRTWRYWSIEEKPWVDEFKNMLQGQNDEVNGIENSQQPTHQEQPKQTRRVFSIKTTNGTFECDGDNYHSLKKALKERFPKMNDESIDKIINNPNNYRMEENTKKIKTIIREVIEELMRNEFRGANNNDVIEITPDMNLGLHSPFETE